MGHLIKLYNENTSEKGIREVVKALNGGAIIIYPTDTLYGVGCSLDNIKGIGKLKELKGRKDDNLSLLCNDIQCAAQYAKIDNTSFKILKANTPAPVTFIMKATGNVPNKFLSGKNFVGIRIPNSNIVRQIVEELGMAIVSTSLPLKNLDEDDYINPELLWEEYGKDVDLFIDGGEALNSPSTVVELSDGELKIIRQGDYEINL